MPNADCRNSIWNFALDFNGFESGFHKQTVKRQIIIQFMSLDLPKSENSKLKVPLRNLVCLRNEFIYQDFNIDFQSWGFFSTYSNKSTHNFDLGYILQVIYFPLLQREYVPLNYRFWGTHVLFSRQLSTIWWWRLRCSTLFLWGARK